MIKLNKFVGTIIFIVLILTIGASILMVRTNTIKNIHQKELDSLNLVIKQQELDIDILENMCKDKEAEISYWGQKYDDCKNTK